jgi:hypothetical protein
MAPSGMPYPKHTNFGIDQVPKSVAKGLVSFAPRRDKNTHFYICIASPRQAPKITVSAPDCAASDADVDLM